jgi:hypothetical protein
MTTPYQLSTLTQHIRSYCPCLETPILRRCHAVPEALVLWFQYRQTILRDRRADRLSIFKRATTSLKILGVRRVTWSKFCTEDPKILGVTLRNLVPRNISTPDLGHMRFYHITRHAETSTQTDRSCLHYVLTSRILHMGSAQTNRSSAQYRFFVHTCQNVQTDYWVELVFEGMFIGTESK